MFAHLILALSVFSTAACTTIFLPCDDTTPAPEGPPLPVLPDQYQTNVKANIVQKNYTINVHEYYDYVNDRVSSTWYDRKTGTETRMVSRVEDNEIRMIFSNGTCHTRSINATGSGFFTFFAGPNGTHVRSVKDIMSFGKEFGEKYMGSDKMVRGILVDHWQSCLKYRHANGNFTLDYYFTKGDNYTVDGHSVRIPVRAVLNGIGESRRNKSAGLHTFYHVYEFTNFHAGPMPDEVFEIPPGVYCYGSQVTKPLPEVPAHFSGGVEQVTHVGDDHEEMPLTLYMDKEAGVMRMDVTTPISKEDKMRYGSMSPLTYIHDNTAGLMYIIDGWEENCTVVKATRDLPQRPFFTYADEFLAIFQGNFVYQGKKMFRGFSVESFAFFNETSKDITEIFFHQSHVEGTHAPLRPGRSVPVPGRLSGTHAAPLVLVGVYMKITNPQPMEKTIHFYGFNPSHPAPYVFDVSRCYSLGHHYVYMAFKVQANYMQYVNFRKREFVTAVRSAIARGAKVSVTRVTSILAEENPYDKNMVVVYFKLLDNQVYGLDSDAVGLSLTQARQNLIDSIAKGLNFDVQYPTIEQNFEVMKNTLWETMSSEAAQSYAPNPPTKYSPGAMAGLGIGMLVVGVLLGLLGAFVIYKRIDTSVPYRETN